MENEPKRIVFTLEAFGKEHECTPDNTLAIVHDDPHAAYNCIVHEPEGQEPFVIFKESMSNFDDVLEYMTEHAYPVTLQKTVAYTLKGLYLDAFGRDPYHKEVELKRLTPRQERLVSFLVYLLDKDHLTPEEFKGNGDLFI